MNLFRLIKILVSLILIHADQIINHTAASGVNSSLQLVHVIFRHGDRNPDLENLWKTNPYYNESYYKEGYGQLTNAGKQTLYKLGLSLRQRYDDFLGDTWNVKFLHSRSTDYDRTKMSMASMLAALWPPKNSQIWWEDLSWQPIPYNYLPVTEDKELLSYRACSNFNIEEDKVLTSDEIKNYMAERYNKTFQILSENTGEKDIKLLTAFLYYFGMLIQEQLNFPLDSWTQDIYPEPLHSLAMDMYYIQTNNTILRQLSTGYLLKQILNDTEAKINNNVEVSDLKMSLYAAHEGNVGKFLLSLNLLNITDAPPYGSYILVELHLINNEHGIKVYELYRVMETKLNLELFQLFYQDNKQNEPIPLKLNNCDYFCPYDQFYESVKAVLPSDDDSECKN